MLVEIGCRACLGQLNFTTKAVFLENSFMSDFLDEAELCLLKVFGKIASPTTSYIVEKRNEGQAAISYFFSSFIQLMSL